MRAECEAPLSRWRPYGIGLLGFCVGLAVMRFLLPLPDRADTADDGLPASTSSSASAARHDGGDSSAATAKSRTRPAGKDKQRQAVGRLGFTRAQWTKVMRNPRHFYVSLQQCFPVPGSDEIAAGRLFDGRGFLSDPHPSFAPQADLFGWSQDLREQVRELVLAYARSMAETEKMGARVEYPEPGLIRIDFGTVHAEREAVASALRKQLETTVGRRDAERFLALASLEGVSDGVKDDLTIRAETLESGDVRIIGLDGLGSVLGRSLAESAFGGKDSHFTGLYDGRLGHLGLTIDWSRLNPDPDADPDPESR